MNAHASASVLGDAVELIDGVDDVLDGPAGEVVAEDVDADLAVGGVERRDGRPNPLDRTGIRLRAPGRKKPHDVAPAAFGVGNPAAGELRKHVAAHVVHDLDALDAGIDLQRFLDLPLDDRPSPLAHAARGVDDEDDVLAVDRDATDGVGAAHEVEAQQTLHLLGQRLLGPGEPQTLVGLKFGLFTSGVVAGEDVVKVAFQPSQLGQVSGQLPLLVAELPRQDPRAADDFVERVPFLGDEALEIDHRLLEEDRFHGLDDHQQQDDGTESTADDVEERQADLFQSASRDHGQSLDGDMYVPPLRPARIQ